MSELNLRYLKDSHGELFMPMVTTDCIADFDKESYDSDIDSLNIKMQTLETIQNRSDQTNKTINDKQTQDIDELKLSLKQQEIIIKKVSEDYDILNSQFKSLEEETETRQKEVSALKDKIDESTKIQTSQQQLLDELIQRIDTLEGGSVNE